MEDLVLLERLLQTANLGVTGALVWVLWRLDRRILRLETLWEQKGVQR